MLTYNDLTAREKIVFQAGISSAIKAFTATMDENEDNVEKTFVSLNLVTWMKKSIQMFDAVPSTSNENFESATAKATTE